MELCNFTTLHVKQRLSSLFVITLLSLFGATTLLAQAGGTFIFKVRDQQTGFGVSGARVSVYTEAGRNARPVSVHDAENLSLNMDEGYYRFIVKAPGYADLETYFYSEPGNTLTVGVQLDPLRPTSALRQRMAASRNGMAPQQTDKTVIEGYVSDEANGQPLAGVSVKVGVRTARTDEGGYFRLEMPVAADLLSRMETPGARPDQTTVFFEKDGFRAHMIEDFNLVPGNFSLKVAMENGISGGRLAPVVEKQLHGQLAEKPMEKPAFDSGLRNPFMESQADANTAPAVPSSIRVGMNCGSSCYTCGYVQVYNLETYVQLGLDNEWYSWWHSNSLKAGAVAYRTYAAYHVLNPYRSNFDITSNTCRQAFGTEDSDYTIAAAVATAGEVLVQYNTFAFSEYSSENNNSGCGNGYSGTGSGWPCISDNLCINQSSYGHGRGMCQFGSSRWANNGQTYTWILDHYYNPGGIVRGSGSSSGTNLSLNATPYAYSSQYSADFSPAKALDGDVYTKWTSDGSGQYSDMYLNLNGYYNINKFVLKHAGAGGEWSAMNTENYTIWYWNGSAWIAYINYANSGQANVTEHTANISAQFISLSINDPGIDNYTRLPEFEIHGSSGSRAAAQTLPPLRDEAASLVVFPNPAEEVLNVRFGKARSGDYTLSLVDTQGREVFEQTYSKTGESQGTEINVSDLHPGMYVLTVSGQEGTEVIRFQVR